MARIKKIELKQSDTTGKYSLTIGFNNNRFKQLNISPDYTHIQLAMLLHDFSENIANDELLEDFNQLKG